MICDGQTDRQTDGRTDARGKTICLPTLSGGDIKSNSYTLFKKKKKKKKKKKLIKQETTSY